MTLMRVSNRTGDKILFTYYFSEDLMAYGYYAHVGYHGRVEDRAEERWGKPLSNGKGGRILDSSGNEPYVDMRHPFHGFEGKELHSLLKSLEKLFEEEGIEISSESEIGFEDKVRLNLFSQLEELGGKKNETSVSK